MNADEVKQALLALDAEVLKFYDLPPRLERQLLDLFTDVERKGVGCEFRGYDGSLPLSFRTKARKKSWSSRMDD